MAQINIIGDINSSTIINRFDSEDINLAGAEVINNSFIPSTDYIEYIIYDAAGNFLNINYNYNNYNLPSGSNFNVNGDYPILELNPSLDLQSFSNVGEFITQYSFYRKHISNYINRDIFIKDISPDRTELKVTSLTYSNDVISQQANLLIDDKNSVPYLKTYLLNFGNNNVFPIVNIALDTSNPNQYCILFKLYKPLPSNINEKSSFWVVEEITNAIQFDITLETQVETTPLPQLRGANFDIEVSTKNTLPTHYESQNTLNQLLSGSSLQNVLNYLGQESIEINVDYNYTDINGFSEFIRFGSAQARINNFYYKVQQIENYNNFITAYSASAATTASIQNQINQYSSSINNYVINFDGFESYMYFQSGSGAWPKSNSTAPYNLQSTGSSASITWYNNILNAAILYDNNNLDNLIYLIPEYIRIDSNNAPYLTFINMIGHYFDNIWIYLKSVTDINVSYNNLSQGISSDLVYYALQDLGVKIYNSNEDDSLYDYIIGDNQIPTKDLLAELYKRIYHNIPLLFKGKGSRRGLQELITTFGITGSILGIKEYGGNSNTNAALLDYSTNKVRIVNNSIYSSSYNNTTGSILSPILSLATDNTYTNYKIDNNRIDVSFSPYNQIDTAISKSIASMYPTFSIDDYIGDPRNAYSTQYGSLNSIRAQAISSSFSYKYDITGFIQLIQYFDNTLFKMLKNYVPAKSNLTEGVTIRQQALERIKFKRHEPYVEEETPYDACLNTPNINSNYQCIDLYNKLSGSKIEFYNGEISGSNISVYEEYFIPYNKNPYLFPTSSINISYFALTDYNVLFNNVSQSRLSLNRKKVEIQEYTSSKLLLPVELQDSYETLTSYRLSRHDGVKLTGEYYNVYTPGDISYGLNPVINRNSYKFGWVRTIPSTNLNFYNKTQIILKYLVDPSGSLLELNSQNNNLFEVQNTFKSQQLSNVSLTNLLSPTNQTSLNGPQMVWQSGYRYDPILYREQSDTLYFQWLDSSLYTSSYNLGIDTLMGSSYKFHNINCGQQTYFDNTPSLTEGQTQHPTWYKDDVSQGVLFSNYRIPSSTWPYTSDSSSSFATSSYFITSSGGSLSLISSIGTENPSETHAAWAFDNIVFDKTLLYTETTPGLYSYQGSSYTYKSPRNSTYFISGSLPVKLNLTHKVNPSYSSNGIFKLFIALEKTTTPLIESSWYTLLGTSQIIPISWPTYTSAQFGYNSYESSIMFGGSGTCAMTSPFTFNLNLSQSVSLNAGDYLRARVYFLSVWGVFGTGVGGDAYFDPLIIEFTPNASFNIYDNNTTGTSPISTTSYTGGVPLFYTSSTNSIVITGSAWNLYNSSSFINSGSSVLANYSPIYDSFTIQPGDIFRFGSFYSPSATYHTVTNVSFPTISFADNITSSINNNQFAILRRKPDETSVLINFIKSPGETSQAFLIPGDMNLDLASNVANVATQISTQINNL